MFSMDMIWLISCLVAGYLVMSWIYSLRRRNRLSAKNKTVLITGCDSGFGYELALRLPAFGYHVFAGCLFIKGEGAKTLSSIPGVDVIELDVTNEANISAAAKTVSEKLGDDVLWAIVNNAGIPQVGEIEWCPMETILKVFDVNTFGVIRVTKEFLPLIKKSKGRIINVTSISGNRRIPGMCGYSMSKAAARSFTNGIRIEMKKWDVKVIEVAPYFYRTPLIEKHRINELLKQSWDCSGPEISETLGIEYFKKYINFIQYFLKLLCISNKEEVVNCMIDGVTTVSPRLLYKPGNIINVLLVDIVEYLPLYLQDFFQSLVLPKLNAKQT